MATVHRPSGWSWAGFRLLFVLWVLGPVDYKTAAAASGMSRPAVTALVRTLERDGMVQKLGDPHDGRSVVIALTGGALRICSFSYVNFRESLCHALGE